MAVVQSVHFLNPYSTEHNLIGTFCWLVPLQKDSFSQVHYCCPTGNWLPLPGKTEDDISCSFCFLSPSVMSLCPVPQVGNQQNALSIPRFLFLFPISHEILHNLSSYHLCPSLSVYLLETHDVKPEWLILFYLLASPHIKPHLYE